MKRVRKALKKYFIPHEENDHKPHILRARSVVFVLVIALAVEGVLWFGETQLAPHSELFGIIVSNALVDETNQNRVTNGDSALAVSPLLMTAAQEKATDMANNNYFAHTSPTGVTPWSWFGQVGYSFTYAGENLAVNFSDSQDVTNAWMASAEHRANILDPSFTQIGIATAQGTYDGHPATYVVELFGTPVPPAPPAEPIAFVNAASAAASSTSHGVIAPILAASKSKVKAVAASSTLVTQQIATETPASAQATTTEIALAPVMTTTVPGTVKGIATSNLPPQTNVVQAAAANPRAVVDYLYLAIIALFCFALALNIFIKIRIQYPQLIFGGMIVILVVGLLVVLNQHLLAGVAIL